MKDKIKDKAMGFIEKVANKVRPEPEPEPKWSEKLHSAAKACADSSTPRQPKYRNKTFREENQDTLASVVGLTIAGTLWYASLAAKGVEYVHENMQEDEAGEEKK